MRNLNKIILINSANVPYAEVELNGNVHFIGTQGVGKSTILRCILFFYNADTQRLGISKEKKPFSDYYFGYGNSFMVYEVSHEFKPFCIILYRNMGKVCYRFVESAYDKKWMLPAGKQPDNWAKIREQLDKQKIGYSTQVDRYEDYRNILYGNTQSMPKFRQFGLLESKSYGNIPRTIQNVFLNSSLSADFIKQTIIDSLGDDPFTIDLRVWESRHLRSFETEYNDIVEFRKEGTAKKIKQVAEHYDTCMQLDAQKQQLAYHLGAALLSANKHLRIQQQEQEVLLQKRDGLKAKIQSLQALHEEKKRKWLNEAGVLDDKLKSARTLQKKYEERNIDSILQRVENRKEIEQQRKQTETERRNLTAKFESLDAQFSVRFQSLETELANAQTSLRENQTKLQLITIQKKEEIELQWAKWNTQWQQQRQESIDVWQEQTDNLRQQKNELEKELHSIKQKKYYEAELQELQQQQHHSKQQIIEQQSEIKLSLKDVEQLQNEWGQKTELAEKDIQFKKQQYELDVANFVKDIKVITDKLAAVKGSFFEWLNEHKKGWENTIGKVAAEHILLNQQLEPANNNNGNFFGINIDLEALPAMQFKPDALVRQKNALDDKWQQTRKVWNQTEKLHEEEKDKLRRKYQPQINALKNSLKEKEYKADQLKFQIKAIDVKKDEWLRKAEETKEADITNIKKHISILVDELEVHQKKRNDLIEDYNKKQAAKLKDKQKRIDALQKEEATQIAELQAEYELYKNNWQQKKLQIELEKEATLKGKGLDTDKLKQVETRIAEIENELKFIDDNRDLATEYRKDKKELIDKIEDFKSDKQIIDDKLNAADEKHKNDTAKVLIALDEQELQLKTIEFAIKDNNEQLKEYERFRPTPVYAELAELIENPGNFTATEDIRTLKDKLHNNKNERVNREEDLRKAINQFTGLFKAENTFGFPTQFAEYSSYLNFARELNSFVDDDRISEFEKRVNQKYADALRSLSKDAGELMGREGDIQKIISNINKDFREKNFVGAISLIEMQLKDSANKIVQVLKRIKIFADENQHDIGEFNLFSSSNQEQKNKEAIQLLNSLLKEMREYRQDIIFLSDSFELQFRIIENQNDTGWVEKVTNVGSEGTDILVKAMINIMLLNVFKESASRNKFKDFRLHCMMDEIGKLHPNNVRGILQFANDRNILLINGSPTENDALAYKHIYKLSKDEKRMTRITRIVSKVG